MSQQPTHTAHSTSSHNHQRDPPDVGAASGFPVECGELPTGTDEDIHELLIIPRRVPPRSTNRKNPRTSVVRSSRSRPPAPKAKPTIILGRDQGPESFSLQLLPAPACQS